jgi:Calcineurin-like phosphoesterase
VPVNAPRAVVVALLLAAGLSAGAVAAAERRSTARQAGAVPATAVVWAVGDGADGGSDAKTLAARIARGPIDRFLYLGDVYDDGTAEEYAENYAPVYGRLDKITAPTPGNHDWRSHEEGYDPYWRRARAGRPLAHHYAFRLAGWQLLSLNSEESLDEGSTQLAWLRAKLKEPGTCRLAFFHRPRYSAGKHGDEDEMAPAWNALRGHATLVVSGHDHDMQRFRPIDGLTQLVSGAGGKSRRELNHGDPRLAFSNNTDDGALRLVLSPGRADLSFVTAAGRTLDATRVACRMR